MTGQQQKNGVSFWRNVAVAMVSVVIAVMSSVGGWWARQLTLEIPPAWFREDVRENTEHLGRLDERLDKLEASNPYRAVVERLIELERRLDEK